MDVTLPPDLAQIVTDLIEGGYYPSPVDAIRAGLTALAYRTEQEEKLADLRDEIDIGLADIEAGRCRPLNREALIDLMRQAAAEAATADRGASR